MMLEMWNDISYMVELLAACMIFLFPMRKKNRICGKDGGI